jgi:hypothetical protein
MEPEKIRVLLMIPEEQLDQAARKFNLLLPVAHSIRLQAMNLVLGKCCLCGYRTQLGVCESCSQSPATGRLVPWSGQELLTKLNTTDHLLSRTCASCQRVFQLNVGYLLHRLRTNSSKTKRFCNTCTEDYRATKKENQDKTRETDTVLTQSPSAGSEALQKLSTELSTKSTTEAKPREVTAEEKASLEEKQRLERVARIEKEKARQRQSKQTRAQRAAPRKPKTEPPSIGVKND